MKNIILWFCFFTVALVAGQPYKINVQISDISLAPKFTKVGQEVKYTGDNQAQKLFFDRYVIYDFRQTYPRSKRENLLRWFTFTVAKSDFADNLLTAFPTCYVDSEIDDTQLSCSSYYPNDYGSQSPIANLGANLNMNSFDYINAPKAWSFTKGAGTTIGISDSKIYDQDADFDNLLGFTDSYYNRALPGGYIGYDNYPFQLDDYGAHGTSVAEIAAGKGNNAHGFAGMCMDCGIWAAAYGYPGLYELAEQGARVINMSWIGGPPVPGKTSQQVIDELYTAYDIIFVAGAGNNHNFSPSGLYLGPKYKYPASLNHVISVSAVCHLNPFETTFVHPDFGEMAWNAEDRLSNSVRMNYLGNGPYPLFCDQETPPYCGMTMTLNDKVDIVAPGFQVPSYSRYLLNHPQPYIDGATSPAAPYVTGTAALMVNLNECISADEVEDILQLTSKSIENLPGNEPFQGYAGAGKLEAGDAVEFVYEMTSPTGNAYINNQDFYRFEFHLNHIMGSLTIDQQKLRDNNISEFTAANAIEISDSDFNPNSQGYVDLKIDTAITVCPLTTSRASNRINSDTLPEVVKSEGRGILYPNPNAGQFTIELKKKTTGTLKATIYNTVGSRVSDFEFQGQEHAFQCTNLQQGVYLIVVEGFGVHETFRFFKN